MIAGVALETLAGPVITVYGSGGIRGKRVCPNPPALICATIQFYSEDIYGESHMVMYDETTQLPNGEEYDVKIIWLGPENQSAEVEFLN